MCTLDKLKHTEVWIYKHQTTNRILALVGMIMTWPSCEPEFVSKQTSRNTWGQRDHFTCQEKESTAYLWVSRVQNFKVLSRQTGMMAKQQHMCQLWQARVIKSAPLKWISHWLKKHLGKQQGRIGAAFFFFQMSHSFSHQKMLQNAKLFFPNFKVSTSNSLLTNHQKAVYIQLTMT